MCRKRSFNVGDAMSISEVWETALRFLDIDDLGRVEVCSLDMLEQCRHCWRQKCQHVGQLLATTMEAGGMAWIMIFERHAFRSGSRQCLLKLQPQSVRSVEQ